MVNVDKEKCISCGNCLNVCSAIFQFDSNNKTEAIKQPETPEEIECTKKAIKICPTQAITFEEQDTEQQTEQPQAE